MNDRIEHSFFGIGGARGSSPRFLPNSLLKTRFPSGGFTSRRIQTAARKRSRARSMK